MKTPTEQQQIMGLKTCSEQEIKILNAYMYITGDNGLRVNSIGDYGIEGMHSIGDYGIEDVHRIGDFGIEDMYRIDQGIKDRYIIGGYGNGTAQNWRLWD